MGRGNPQGVLVTDDGTYQQHEASKAFPFLPLAEVVKFLGPTDESETKLVRRFRAWVRDQLAY